MLPACLPILASSEATEAPCPLCGERSDRVRSCSTRTLADLPRADVAVRVQVRVRKFFCANPACPRAVFAERLAGIARADARRTDRQQTALTAIAFALGGEAGARPSRRRGMPVSPDTLLRLVRRDLLRRLLRRFRAHAGAVVCVGRAVEDATPRRARRPGQTVATTKRRRKG